MLHIYLHPEGKALFTLESTLSTKGFVGVGNGLVFTNRGFYTRKETVGVDAGTIEAINKVTDFGFKYKTDALDNVIYIEPYESKLDIEEEIFIHGPKLEASGNSNLVKALETVFDIMDNGVHLPAQPTKATSLISSKLNITVEAFKKALASDKRITVVVYDPQMQTLIKDSLKSDKPISGRLGNTPQEITFKAIEPLLLDKRESILFNFIDNIDLGTDYCNLLGSKSDHLYDKDHVVHETDNPIELFNLKTFRTGLLGFGKLYNIPTGEGFLMTATNHELGRVDPNLGIALIKLKEPSEPIDIISKIIVDLGLERELIAITLGHIFRSRVLAILKAFNKYGVHKNGVEYLADDVKIFEVIDPPLMAFTIQENVKETLKVYRDLKDETIQSDVIDITESLFTVGERKTTLRKDIPVGTNNVRVKTPKGIIKLRLGTQLPDRNSLGRLKGDIRVRMLFVPKNKVVSNFYIIIETAEGEGIYSNQYVNMIMTK